MADTCEHSWLTQYEPIPPTDEEIKSQVMLSYTPVSYTEYEVCIRCGIKREVN